MELYRLKPVKVWLLSLGIMLLSIHIVVPISIYPFYLLLPPLYEYTTLCLSIPIAGYTAMNKAVNLKALNIHLQIFKWIRIFIYLG